MANVLLVEDDPILGRGLTVNLEVAGYKVNWVRDLKSAFLYFDSLKMNIDLVLLDLQLPDGNGLKFCRHLRECGSVIPIVILTAQIDEDSVVEGLSAGANDYVRKPFGNKELFARIKTALKTPVHLNQKIKYGEIEVIHDERKLLVGDKEIELNRRQFDILTYLVQHAEKVVTRDALLEFLGKREDIVDRTIDSHVSQLRSKLRQEGILTVHINSIYGIGYRLEKNDKK